MAKVIDLTGQRFERLLVLERAPSKNGEAYWKCQCDCGNIKEIRGRNLRNGITVSCGCKGRESLKPASDITNEKFTRLTAIKIIGKDKTGANIWLCKCDCGNETQATVSQLRRGSRKSCGCLNKEKMSILGKQGVIDLTNQRFGKLIALCPTERRQHGCVVWHCRCDCGNYYDASSYLLRTGHISSCGCLGRSLGEETIASILIDNNIAFIQEYSFPDCYDKNINLPLRFDFYVNNQYLIEFDGEQHYKATSGWNTPEHLEIVKHRDTIKNEYCQSHNIPLIRIPYNHINQLCLDDVLLTSQYLVRKDEENAK